MADQPVEAQENVVGQDVEFLLRFALDVFRTRAAQRAHQRAVVHLVRNHLTCGDDVVEQQRQIAVALLFAHGVDDEVGNCDAVRRHEGLAYL